MNLSSTIHRILFLLLVALATVLPAHAWYDPGQGRWCSRDPIGEQGGANLYGFVGNDPVRYRDVLGLRVVSNVPPPGYQGAWDSKDEAGSYGSRSARASTIRDASRNEQREYCGIICCKESAFVISIPHPGQERPYTISGGTKVYDRGPAKCNPRMDQNGRPVTCPDSTWTYSGEYHSHIDIPGQDRFSEGDYERVNGEDGKNDGTGLPLYVGTPDGKVRRLDPDPNKSQRNEPHDGVIVPDTWDHEGKFRDFGKRPEK